jgi:hypothetical protein
MPVSHAHDNDPSARGATYFVIHDTSSPNFGRKAWPADIDGDRKINNLARYTCSNKIERAHTFINRSGEILYPHDSENRGARPSSKRRPISSTLCADCSCTTNSSAAQARAGLPAAQRFQGARSRILSRAV